MATTFRRSRKIAPGVRMNYSKSGMSFSFGARGARTTIGSRGVTTTTGIPGTGVYHREFTSWEKFKEKRRQKRMRKAAQLKELNSIFLSQPLLCLLSFPCFALGILALITPGIPWWLIFPAFIGGSVFFVWAMIRVDNKKSQKAATISDEYTVIHIPSFLNKYYSVVSSELFSTLRQYQMDQIEYVELTKSTITELDNALSSNQ